ncbi:MAG TPA: DNA polymerase I [Bacteroidota bacterium]|nr:DNA polymerase I [Bacteroidota bacterium]
MERLFLIDGMAIAYRAYFAFINRPLINSKGMNTSAIFGFVNTLEKILGDERPDHIAVAFDTKHPTFRHERFPAYKATREKMPDDMVEQLPYLKRIVEAYRIPVIELPGWEADDVIGTLAKRGEAEGLSCVLVTPDKDYMQLVSERVTLFRPGKGSDTFDVVDLEGVREKFGVAPAQVVDVLGLMGDQSDNIPGVKGVGEKTAIPLIQQYGSIDGLYEQLDTLGKPALRQKLEENRDMAMLSRELVTIDVHAPVHIDPHELRAAPRDVATLRSLFAELELKRFLDKLRDDAPVDSTATTTGSGTDGIRSIDDTAHSYEIVRDEQELLGMVRTIAASEAFCFDTETTGLDPLRADIVGLSFAVRPHHAWYVPAMLELALDIILREIAPLFDGSRSIIGQNLKFDLLVLKAAGMHCSAPLYDTMLAAYILRPDGDHDMDTLALQHLRYQPVSIGTLIGKGKAQLSMADVPLDEIAAYAAEDADVTLQLSQVLRGEIVKTGQAALLEKVEFPLVHVLTDMEYHGVRIDTAALEEISLEMEKHIAQATADIHAQAGEVFNIGSTKQLGTILFEKLGLPSGKKTKTGYSTDVSVLESLLGRHPIIESILAYRQLTKLKSTYIDALPRMVHPVTGRVHTSYNQAVAATGRLSSTDPNLQNIPIRSERGREIRRAFVAADAEHVLFSADYSQIELRLAAEISGDEGLLDAFRHGEDIHSSTAMKLFDVPAAEVTSEMRRRAKTTNFGILYGISAFGLAQRLGISNADAKDLIDLYFDRYPRINAYIMKTIAFAQSHGYVETLLGRRRYIPDIKSSNRNVRMFAERTAINAPIQGSAADMIKIAMIRIHEALRDRALRTRMILQVHDELVFDTPRDEVEEVRDLVTRHMTTAMNLTVPIAVDCGWGDNWLEAH